jgi:hypothetical protein
VEGTLGAAKGGRFRERTHEAALKGAPWLPGRVGRADPPRVSKGVVGGTGIRPAVACDLFRDANGIGE